jgi:hypothetical protein
MSEDKEFVRTKEGFNLGRPGSLQRRIMRGGRKMQLIGRVLAALNKPAHEQTGLRYLSVGLLEELGDALERLVELEGGSQAGSTSPPGEGQADEAP